MTTPQSRSCRTPRLPRGAVAATVLALALGTVAAGSATADTAHAVHPIPFTAASQKQYGPFNAYLKQGLGLDGRTLSELGGELLVG